MKKAIIRKNIDGNEKIVSRVKVPHIGPRPRITSSGIKIKVVIKKPIRK